LSTFDKSEEDCEEFTNGNDAEVTKTGTSTVTEESSAVGNVVWGDFIIVKLAGREPKE